MLAMHSITDRDDKGRLNSRENESGFVRLISHMLYVRVLILPRTPIAESHDWQLNRWRGWALVLVLTKSMPNGNCVS
jgi:hypothetical protein